MTSSMEEGEKISLLKVHEWLAIVMIIGIIGGLACLTSSQERGRASEYTTEFSASEFQGFDVLVKGAVDRPGIYHIPSEITLEELLTLAGITTNADLRRLHLNSVIKKGRTIHVPARAMITVHLKGAVPQERSLTVPKGSKLEDLIPMTILSENANIKFLKKKRRLKDGEVITIPEQKGSERY